MVVNVWCLFSFKMYELQNINQYIVKKYYDSIFKTMKKDNRHNIACLSVESAFHEMLSNFSKYELEKYIKDLLKPILTLGVYTHFMPRKEKMVIDFLEKR